MAGRWTAARNICKEGASRAKWRKGKVERQGSREESKEERREEVKMKTKDRSRNERNKYGVRQPGRK